uniref:uncharacterized protein LOC122583328 n=1 Tax=Erigeron canadensis TaxID=72917 RepID=UPI001CB98654|nr:uncharacterized protein LOC122583328 [Erigeron canadensis]
MKDTYTCAAFSIEFVRIELLMTFDVPLSCCCTWGWHKLLLLSDQVRSFIWSQVGNGQLISAWFDKWAPQCPLINFITPRDIRDAGFSLSMRLSDIWNNGNWLWPTAWYDLYPVLINLPILNFNNERDKLVWKDNNDTIMLFSTWGVWNTIRYREQPVSWHSIVWFSQCIPRHSFFMWLILRKKLKTEDLMMKWGVGVWNGVRSLAGMADVSGKMDDIMDWLLVRAKSRSVRNILGRLVVAATAYYVWQERNAHLFTKDTRNVAAIQKIIKSTVRWRLASLKFKNTPNVVRLLEAWDIPWNIDLQSDVV